MPARNVGIGLWRLAAGGRGAERSCAPWPRQGQNPRPSAAGLSGCALPPPHRAGHNSGNTGRVCARLPAAAPAPAPGSAPPDAPEIPAAAPSLHRPAIYQLTAGRGTGSGSEAARPRPGVARL
ncbi:translation initiation factor IF-2-like [Schistocerca cancellata]|uniref:translation initiation factor IF-2-like n=1 Tax=Schistocerca cancellata TaxID=274614 RepID=UPI0021189A6D|nr:translation initiation factor IF-2-like [Schistocerca cancellata]